METHGHWLSITDYSDYREISISTIRRYIKSGQLRHKKENGKYFIFVSEENYQKKQFQKGHQRDEQISKLKLNLKELEVKLRDLQEENTDLKMLVNVYEYKNKKDSTLHSSPN